MMNTNINLTPQEILEREFKIDTRGYRLQEVDKFLDLVIKDYVEFLKTINKLECERKELLEENHLFKRDLHNLKANIDIVKNSEKEITNVDIIRRLSQLEKYIYESSEDK